MPWIYLTIAGLLEVAWAISMKKSEGFTRPLWATLTIVLLLASMILLAAAMKHLPAGTAYAVWTGIGAFGTVIVGIAFLGEPVNAPRVLCLALLMTGIVGLKITA